MRLLAIDVKDSGESPKYYVIITVSEEEPGGSGNIYAVLDIKVDEVRFK